MRAVISSSESRRQNDTFVRFGKSSVFDSIGAPYRDRSRSQVVATSIAHCGLPIETCWYANSRSALVSGVPSESPSLARPMSTVHVVSPVIVGRISPAAVSIENVSESVQPRRRR